MICPYCEVKISAQQVEAEDGLCPECGIQISAASEFDDDLDNDDLELEDDDLELETRTWNSMTSASTISTTWNSKTWKPLTASSSSTTRMKKTSASLK